MRKKRVPKKTEKRRPSYKPEILIAAWKAVENGMTMYQASKLFGVPKQTLGDRKSGRVRDPLRTGTGQLPVFKETHERNLVNHITYLTSLGYGFSRIEVIVLATDYAHFLSLLPGSKSLSNGWFYKFLERWPKMQLLRPKITDRAKSTTPEALKHYYSELKNLMEKYILHDKPHCIYYVEEIGINCEHKPGTVITLKNNKPSAVLSSRSVLPTVTVIACGNAVGSFVPPFIIFKGKHKSANISQNCTDGSTICMSDTGWSNDTRFLDFLQNHFLKYCMGTDSDYKLLMYDGHATHINIPLIDWAREHKIILFVLPPHTSPSTQPLEVGSFDLFKQHLHTECASFMRKNRTDTITKYDLGEIICKIYPKVLCHEHLVSSFQKTGIYPLNAEVIDKLGTSPVFTDQSSNSKADEADEMDNSENTDPVKHRSKIKTKKTKNKRVKKKRTVNSEHISKATDPVPSTSTEKVSSKEIVNADSSSDMEIGDDEKCCVCGLFEPAQLKNIYCVEIVHWAQCENCKHWVHLKFCIEQRVVRRNTVFLCPHCLDQ